jgi:hypothetical protein
LLNLKLHEQLKSTKTEHSGSLFGEVIFSYTRAQAIADRVLVDVTPTALEAGFRFPVAATAALMAAVETIPQQYPHETLKAGCGTCFGWLPSPLAEPSRGAHGLPLR